MKRRSPNDGMSELTGNKVRMVIIGGFLGSGKTTIITKIAKELKTSGVNVGLIMNDQADALVDSQYSEALGLNSCEVAGGCFCCRFPDFMKKTEKLIDVSKPQMMIAEPVGSCTDLLATVINPLKTIYQDKFEVCPLIIMIDTARALSEGFDQGTLSGYLRHHQLDEAEIVVLSKSDLVTMAEVERVRSTVKDINPAVRIIVYSSVTDEGFQDVLGIVKGKEVSVRKTKDIDYERYAQAEAELGWYNATLTLDMPRSDAFVMGKGLLEALAIKYPASDIAHAKIMLTSDKSAMKMSCVQGRVSVDMAKGSRYMEGRGRLTVNARVVSSPGNLKENVRAALRTVLKEEDLVFEAEECFAPSPPKPFHRMTD
jgi:G3E family GTPase